MINRKSNLEGANKEKLFSSFMETLHDDNLNEISSKAIRELISKPQNSSLPQNLLNIIRESLINITTEAQYKRMWTRVKLARICGLCEPQLINEILNVLIRLSISSNQEISKLASKNFIRFIEVLSKKETQLVRNAVTLLLPFLNDSQCKWKIKISTSKTIKKIMKFSDKADVQLFESVLNALRSLLQDSNRDVTILLSRKIRRLVVMTSNNHNIQITQDAFQLFKRLLDKDDILIKAAASKNIVELIKKKGFSCDELLSIEVLKTLILLLKNSNSFINTSASTNLSVLLKVDTKLIGNAINGLISALEAPEDDVRRKALDSIMKLCHNHDVQLARSVLDKLAQYWKNAELDGKKRELRIIIELLKITGNNDKDLIQSLTQILAPFLRDSHSGNRISALHCLTEVVKGDMDLTLKAIRAFKPMLKDGDPNVRGTASRNITWLVREKHPQLLDETITDLLEFSENSEWNIKTSVAEIIGGLQIESSDTGLIQKVLDTLIPLLQDKNPDVRITASNSMINVLRTSGQDDSDLVQKVLGSLIPLLEDSNSDVKMTASGNLAELMDISNNYFLRDVIRTLASLAYSQYAKASVQTLGEFNIKALFKMENHNSFEVLQGILRTLRLPLRSNDRNARVLVSKKIDELMIIDGPDNDQLFQEVVGVFEALLSDSNWESTELASCSLIAVMKRSNK